MSDRSGAPRGRGRGGARGARGGAAAHSNPARPVSGPERPKREAILDLSRFRDQKIRVKFAGGREVVGVLKGWDQLMNMVLDDVQETVRDPATGQPTGALRTLGLTVLRGTALTVVNPVDGSEQIENPFAQAA